jgi:uncharacterized protein (TIGR02996 family)
MLSMNDDEAFIRAIVAAPRDDAPRLVYADWLDEHGDSRATYLRSQQGPDRGQAPQPGLTRGLDPLWVARVSRPPLGVCCDRIRFRDSGPALTSADLDRIERQLNVTLPTQYRAFLLNYNGGVPEPGQFLLEGQEPEERHKVEWLWGIGADGPRISLPLERVATNLRRAGAPDPVNQGLLPLGYLATLDDMLVISIAGDQQGRVYYFNDYPRNSSDREAMTEIALSFGHFFDTLRNYDPDWVELIARGDVAAVERWLENDGDVEEIDPTTDTAPLYHAVWSSQPAMVRLLVEWGAIVSGELLSIARQYGNREIIQLLTAPFRGQG